MQHVCYVFESRKRRERTPLGVSVVVSKLHKNQRWPIVPHAAGFGLVSVPSTDQLTKETAWGGIRRAVPLGG